MGWYGSLAAGLSSLGILRIVIALRRRAVHPDQTEITRTALRGAALWIRDLVIYVLRRRGKREWVMAHAVLKYTQRLSERHRYMKVPGRSIELPIDQCYIPLELRAGRFHESTQLIESTGTVVIIGGPGSGKSALLSRMVRTLTQRVEESRRTSRLPVYATLHDLATIAERADTSASGSLRDPETAFGVLRDWFSAEHLAPLDLFDADDLLHYFAHGSQQGLVVILDGLDEVGAERIALIEDLIIGLTRYLDAAEGRSLVVIASRRQVLELLPDLMANGVDTPTSVELRPFTPAAMYSFLLRWPFAGIDRQQAASEIFAQLRLSASLLDTCSNPLSLALYVDRYLLAHEVGSEGRIMTQETRAGFYTDIVDHLLVRRKLARLELQAPNMPFRQVRLSFFVNIAREHIESEEPFNELSNASLVQHAETIARDGEKPEQALVELARDSGLIERTSPDTWRFIHRAFLDYFLACDMATTSTNRRLDKLLRNVRRDPDRYVEGFFLATGLMATRNAVFLARVLDEVGKSQFVGRLYPRVCLESQSYFHSGFVDRIKYYCNSWQDSLRRTGRTDDELLNDLVTMLIDYEAACRELGRSPEVSLRGQLWASLQSQGVTALQAAQLDVRVALQISQEPSTLQLLVESPIEDAVIALYEPTIVEQIDIDDLCADPHASAIVIEAALRSSLLAARLAHREGKGPPLQRGRHAGRWGQSWAVRGTDLGRTLDVALAHLSSLQGQSKADFPHLSLLSSCRPIRRLRYELLLGDWRLASTIGCVAGVALAASLLLGESPPVTIGVTVLSVLLVLAGFRLAVLRGRLSLPSRKILNLSPGQGLDISTALGGRARLVSGDPASLRKYTFRRPKSSDGRITAVYDRALPFVWRRYAPSLGDSRTSRAAVAWSQQQVWTDDLRRLFVSGRN